MSRFSVIELPLPGLKLVKRMHIGDSRGFLSRLFCRDELATAGWENPIAQINHTLTNCQGAVRGMHYQLPPYAEMKLVSCLAGEVWDVAVDLRANSPTFLQWHAEHLSSDNGCALLIPQGFAHGFQVLSEGAQLLYCHSAAYAPKAEAGLSPLDPRLSIAWPLPISELSQRDAMHPLITTSFTGVCP